MQRKNDFQRPAEYWLRRADTLWRGGSVVQATVLMRHAARGEPNNTDACDSYAYALSLLECYEASIREAFASLAQHPERVQLYSLIGFNLIYLGRQREGLRALRYALSRMPEERPYWQEEADEVLENEASTEFFSFYEQGHTRATPLVRLALRRVRRDEPEKARELMRRVSRMPAQWYHPQARLTEALALARDGHPEAALARVREVLLYAPRDVEAVTEAARVYLALGKPERARRALLFAAVAAGEAAQERLVCRLCGELGELEPARLMLERLTKESPHRLPYCHDLAVCLARMGHMQEALRSAHLCREIDPDDLYGQWLLEQLEERGDTDALSWYDEPNQAMWYGRLRPVALRLLEGEDPSALLEDRAEWNKLQEMLVLPGAEAFGARALARVAEAADEAAARVFLREAALRQTADTPVWREAERLLRRMGEEPPRAMWPERRSQVRALLEEPWEGNLRQRLICRRVRQASRLCPGDDDFPLWALRAIGQLPYAALLSLLRDAQGVWPRALAQLYRARAGQAPLPLSLTDGQASALQSAVRALQGIHC